jgi:ABC-type Fe3+ transport system permease subunit
LGINVFTTEIFTQFTAFYNYSSAITHGLVLTLACLLLIIPERYYLSQAPFISFGKRSFKRLIINLKNKKKWLILLCLYLLSFVFLPILMLTVQAFSRPETSFLHTVYILLPALKDSLLLSLTGSLIITVFGYAFALISTRYNIKFVDSLLLIVFAVPAIVTGIALTKFFNTPALNFIYGTSLIVLIAFMARFIFIAQKIIEGGLMQIPSSYREAASLKGASTSHTIRKVTFPLLFDALFTSFFIILIFSVAELTTVIMVYPPGISLLPVRIFTLMANAPQSTTSAMCLVALLFTMSFIVIMMTGRKVLINQQWMKNQS